MVTAIETEIITPTNFYTERLKHVSVDILAGKQEAYGQLIDIIGNEFVGPGQFHYYGDLIYTREAIAAIEQLPLIDPDQSLPIIQHILKCGMAEKTVQEMVQVAADALSEIKKHPQALGLIPLINQHILRLRGIKEECLDEEENEFTVNRVSVIRSLQKAYSTILWNTSGTVDQLGQFVLPLLRSSQGFLVLQADSQRRQIVCFDLEGPLSGMDCAFDVFSLIPGGNSMYKAISYYDDIVCGLVTGKRDWRKEDYEAGDTLKLIIPHLIHHGLTENDIMQVSAKATLVPGVKELFDQLRAENWKIKIVSTSYSQHAYNIGSQLGIPERDIYCTRLPLNDLKRYYTREVAVLLKQIEGRMRLFDSEDFGTQKDTELKQLLDRFYWQDLPKTRLGQAMGQVIVIGGARKAWAVERIARNLNIYIEQMTFVGDSITDAQVEKMVEAARGLAIAFNGNGFVIPFATAGLATLDMRNFKPMLDVWKGTGRIGLKDWLQNPADSKDQFSPQYHWLSSADERELQGVIDTHARFRRRLREDAASLG